LLLAMLAPEASERPPAREVEERLAALMPAGKMAATPPDRTAFVPVQGPGTAAARPADVFLRGALGRFRLITKLGEGGMGEVWRAEDPADGSTVALKVLRSDWARDESARRRFLKEARLLGEVNHPNVANLLEVNEDQGIHYLALEYVAGQ